MRRIEKHIRSCSNNYQQDCYILKLDIKGYFMSIDKKILQKLIYQEIEKQKNYRNLKHPYISYEYGKQLLGKIIDHDPTQDYTRI